MELDPLISLALAVHQSPGVYALLLGSGVSHSAGIPTGWGIMVDLIRKVAAQEREAAEPTPEKWYRARFKAEPTYDDLLAALGRTPADRQGLLRSYFEPSGSDDEPGAKAFQPGHRAIARLVKGGYVKLIITTNFDTLLEAALRAEGVEPDVVCTESDFAGVPPLVHSKHTLLKLHGDYRDTRILNAPAELAQYGTATTEFLRSAFDSFGLIVCGWSAEYDVALREALLAGSSRRYTTYWANFGRLTSAAEQVIATRGAVVIPIDGADSFFEQLAGRVNAVGAGSGRRLPPAKASAVHETKRLLATPDGRIPLEDLFAREVERVKVQTEGDAFPIFAERQEDEALRQLALYESVTDTVSRMVATLAWYDDGRNAHLVTRGLDRLADVPQVEGRYSSSLEALRLYPALRVQYAAGVAACGSDRIKQLGAILQAPVIADGERRDLLLLYAAARRVLPLTSLARRDRASRTSRLTPASDYMHASMRDVLRVCIPSDSRYALALDVFEYLAGVVYWSAAADGWAPVGRFGWRRESREPLKSLISQVRSQGALSPLLQGGLFAGDPSLFAAAASEYEEFVEQVTFRW